MKQLGLSPSETALIYGTMPFLGAIVRPLIGALADKLHAHKVISMQTLSNLSTALRISTVVPILVYYVPFLLEIYLFAIRTIWHFRNSFILSNLFSLLICNTPEKWPCTE